MLNTVYRILIAALAGCVTMAAANVWTVRIEEPTGIERRDGELIRIPIGKVGGHAQGYRVVDAQGREVPAVVDAASLVFPVSVIGAGVVEYRVMCCESREGRLREQVSLYTMASGRIELRNDHVRLVVDPRSGQVVEAFNLQAGEARVLNLVERTPDEKDRYDMYDASPVMKDRSGTPVVGPNGGWEVLGGLGAVQKVEMETTPLTARLTLRGERGVSVLALDAGSPVVRWKGSRGFRFARVSATPFWPFNRCVDGNEYTWPTGPGSGEPPEREIAARKWMKPVGGHFVYYHASENYGALAVAALDETLDWAGACTSRFEGRSRKAESEVALLFTRWRAEDTALGARAENRRVRNPLLVEVGPGREGEVEILRPLRLMRAPAVAEVKEAPAEWRPRFASLDGEWELAWGEKGAGPSSEWRKVQVPGSVHLQWLPRSDVYKREAGWVSYKEWWYKRTLRVPAEWGGQTLRLQFGATDYFAETFIDGHRLGRHEGYVTPHEYDVTALVKPGQDHELKVRVWTPVHYYWKHRPYTVKGAYGGVDQKPDDITATGITRSVRIVAGTPARIADVAVDTRLNPDGSAAVAVQVAAEGVEDDSEWEATLTPRNFEGGAGIRLTAAVEPGRGELAIPVRQPQLWWTWEHGKPNLYTLDLRLKNSSGEVVDARRMAVGIRTITRVGERFYLNGKHVFLRGTNVYANLWLSEMGRKEYERDFEILQKMNINLIRIHCHFENPEFYELADERGLFIWQDYLEAWYPHDHEFSPRAAALFDDHIRMVRNHPSVMAWCGSDEEDFENYLDLVKHVAARPSLLDPQDRYVQPSTSRWGDAHLYYGWYGGSIWNYARMTAPLVTELGATALPAKESLDRFMKDRWPITEHAELWHYHWLQIPEATKAWGDLSGKQSPEQLIDKSQRYAARLFQIALERTRRNKREGAAGIFHFFAIDFWPSVTMAAVDFYRVPTRVHAQVARSFEPVLASLEFDRDEWRTGDEVKVGVWGINDLHKAIANAEIRWRYEDSTGKLLTSGQFRHSFGPDSAEPLGEAKWVAGTPGGYRLVAEVTAGGEKISQNVFEFRVAP
ncbi:MAG: hypothetical protein KJZ79_16800 [Bryobacteraceae bacterium]|nr:hypothetical protein [Bryobacteraceae bacterium]